MSSTNKTTNYELSQYVGADKPTYLGDYNSDMLKIDTQMKNNADNITSVGATANTASTNATQALTDASTAQSTANDANTLAGTANTTATSALNKATANEADIALLKNKSYVRLKKHADTQYTSNVSYYEGQITGLDLQKSNGQKITYDSTNSKVVIGEGVSNVRVSGMINCSNIPTGTEFGLNIVQKRNGTKVDGALNVIIASSSFLSVNTDSIFQVEKDDEIILDVYIDQNNRSLYVRNLTYLVVEEI